MKKKLIPKHQTGEELNKLDSLDIDYIHLDVMDGMFVPNTQFIIEEIKNIAEENNCDNITMLCHPRRVFE